MTSVIQWLRAIGPDLRLEAELLLCHHLEVSRTYILTHPELELDTHTLAALTSDAKRLCAGEPVAYLLGHREFWGLSFEVTPDVLIPRPETELLVEVAAEKTIKQSQVLELGTGSGAIAISLGLERPDLNITAIDNSTAALEVAQQNARALNSHVKFAVSNWFESVAEQFEVILSNPPYVAPKDPHLDGLRYEPHSALVAGNNGLADLLHIIHSAINHLKPGGWLMLEHGYDQGANITASLSAAGYVQVQVHDDLAGHHRATSAHKPPHVT
jgi:release factor glutamine methyltransferase